MNYKNNQTLKFILPLVIKLPLTTLIKDNFVGAYIGDVDKPEYDGKVLLVYKVPMERLDLKFELKLMQDPNYLTSYDYDEKRIVIYVFNIPEESTNSIELIIEGKHSSMNTKDKLEILKFWECTIEKNKEHNPLLKEILYPINDKDIWFKSNFTEELFYIKELQ